MSAVRQLVGIELVCGRRQLVIRKNEAEIHELVLSRGIAHLNFLIRIREPGVVDFRSVSQYQSYIADSEIILVLLGAVIKRRGL
ncbi:hypothetical protein D3C81_1084110 [compost metagenome]